MGAASNKHCIRGRLRCFFYCEISHVSSPPPRYRVATASFFDVISPVGIIHMTLQVTLLNQMLVKNGDDGESHADVTDVEVKTVILLRQWLDAAVILLLMYILRHTTCTVILSTFLLILGMIFIASLQQKNEDFELLSLSL